MKISKAFQIYIWTVSQSSQLVIHSIIQFHIKKYTVYDFCWRLTQLFEPELAKIKLGCTNKLYERHPCRFILRRSVHVRKKHKANEVFFWQSLNRRSTQLHVKMPLVNTWPRSMTCFCSAYIYIIILGHVRIPRQWGNCNIKDADLCLHNTLSDHGSWIKFSQMYGNKIGVLIRICTLETATDVFCQSRWC